MQVHMETPYEMGEMVLSGDAVHRAHWFDLIVHLLDGAISSFTLGLCGLCQTAMETVANGSRFSLWFRAYPSWLLTHFPRFECRGYPRCCIYLNLGWLIATQLALISIHVLQAQVGFQQATCIHFLLFIAIGYTLIDTTGTSDLNVIAIEANSDKPGRNRERTGSLPRTGKSRSLCFKTTTPPYDVAFVQAASGIVDPLQASRVPLTSGYNHHLLQLEVTFEPYNISNLFTGASRYGPIRARAGLYSPGEQQYTASSVLTERRLRNDARNINVVLLPLGAQGWYFSALSLRIMQVKLLCNPYQISKPSHAAGEGLRP
ncbi:hypothetical protein BKA70DRAFT_1411950 [Coprinopsis sp. MPI-PUGE-AT-0042]|nr:hypothetical protein BKA70DRAFT_1411950 [Coprinopsis sp. MPI-PUGE-AT-0042]